MELARDARVEDTPVVLPGRVAHMENHGQTEFLGQVQEPLRDLTHSPPLPGLLNPLVVEADFPHRDHLPPEVPQAVRVLLDGRIGQAEQFGWVESKGRVDEPRMGTLKGEDRFHFRRRAGAHDEASETRPGPGEDLSAVGVECGVVDVTMSIEGTRSGHDRVLGPGTFKVAAGQALPMRWIPLLLLALLAFPAEGLRLSGQLYELGPGPDFEPVAETLVVEAQSGGDLVGRAVTSRGAYSLDLGPGEYHIIARSPTGEVRASENVSLRADSRLDIILLPPLDIPDLSLNESILGNLTLPTARGERGFPWTAAAVGAAAAGGAGLWVLRRRRRKTGLAPPSASGVLPDDLQAMVRVLEQEGGRMTQKELRRRLGYSEAKISLMVADLENRGLVQKFKVGRGNIVVLETGPGGDSRPAEVSQSDKKGDEGS